MCVPGQNNSDLVSLLFLKWAIDHICQKNISQTRKKRKENQILRVGVNGRLSVCFQKRPFRQGSLAYHSSAHKGQTHLTRSINRKPNHLNSKPGSLNKITKKTTTYDSRCRSLQKHGRQNSSENVVTVSLQKLDYIFLKLNIQVSLPSTAACLNMSFAFVGTV